MNSCGIARSRDEEMASTSPGRSRLETMAFVTSSSSRRWSRSVESCRCVACAPSKRTTRCGWRARPRKRSSGSRRAVIDSATATSAWKRSTRDGGPVEVSRAAPAVSMLLLEHRPAFMSHEQVVHVVRVLLLLREDPFEQHPCGGIPVAEVAHHLAVGLDGDALGDQIFLDHVDQVLALGVLRGGPGADAVRVQVRLAAELIDPLGEEIEMLLFLLRVLSELFLDRLAGEPGRADGVVLVAEDADDLRGDRVVQEGDGVFHLAPVVLRDGAFAQMLPSPAPNLLDIRKEPLSSTHCLSSLLHDDPFPEASRAVAPASHPPPTAL